MNKLINKSSFFYFLFLFDDNGRIVTSDDPYDLIKHHELLKICIVNSLRTMNMKVMKYERL